MASANYNLFSRYTDEVFKINTVYPGRPVSYTTRGEDDEPILGKFFKQNFSKTRPDEESTLRIERVLQTRRRNGATEYKVKMCRRSGGFKQLDYEGSVSLSSVDGVQFLHYSSLFRSKSHGDGEQDQPIPRTSPKTTLLQRWRLAVWYVKHHFHQLLAFNRHA